MSKICYNTKLLFENLYKKIFIQKCKILFIGLNGSGKSTLIQTLFEDEYKEKKASQRIMISKYEKESKSFFCFDIPGSKDQRSKWDHYYKKCDLLIFTLDSIASEDQIKESREELQGLLYRNTWLNRSILVLCTKNDQENAISCKDAILKLDLTSLQNNDVSCFSISAKNKTNLNLITDWLSEQCQYIGKKKK